MDTRTEGSRQAPLTRVRRCLPSEVLRIDLGPFDRGLVVDPLFYSNRREHGRLPSCTAYSTEDSRHAPLTRARKTPVMHRLLEDRYDMRSTIIASQLPVENWHEQLGDPTVADAILDRVLHNAHRVVLQGPSRRKEVSPLQ